MAELAIYGGIVAVALAAMAIYIQRGYQGYLYSTASSHGSQFDYRNGAWSHTQGVGFTQQQDITITSAQPAVEMPEGNEDLPTIPGGVVTGRQLQTTSTVTSTWNVQRGASYEAQ